MEIAIGCKPHTGWAAAVLVGGDPARPVVLDRRRITLCPDDLPGAVYHHAHMSSLPIGKAAASVAKVERAVESTTATALDELCKVAAEHGEVVAMGIVGLPREVPPLEKVLGVHMLLHLAEGELYRRALDEAARWQGLRVGLAPPKGTVDAVATMLGCPGLPATLTGLRGELGAPWQVDQRDATAAALLALAS